MFNNNKVICWAFFGKPLNYDYLKELEAEGVDYIEICF